MGTGIEWMCVSPERDLANIYRIRPPTTWPGAADVCTNLCQRSMQYSIQLARPSPNLFIKKRPSSRLLLILWPSSWPPQAFFLRHHLHQRLFFCRALLKPDGPKGGGRVKAGFEPELTSRTALNVKGLLEARPWPRTWPRQWPCHGCDLGRNRGRGRGCLVVVEI